MSTPPTPQDNPHGGDPSSGAGGHVPPPPPPGGDQQAAPQGGYQQGPPQGGYQQGPPQGGYPQGGYQPAPGYQQGPVNKVGQPAELMDRFLARFIDYVILFVFNMIVVGFLIVSLIMGSSAGFGFGGGGDFVASLVTSVLFAAIYLGYFAFMESSRGQTVGKMVMKLETRGPGGGRPTMEQAIRRNIWVAFGIIGVIPVLGALLAGLAQLAATILIAVGISGDTVGRRGWHDNFAGGTQVVKIG